MKRIIALVLSLLVLAAAVVYLLKAEKEESGKVSSLYAQVEPLERERQALQEELNTLEASYALKTRDYGTVEILFPKMDPQVYSEAYPIMRDQGVVGVLGFSNTSLPNQYSTMKLEEVNRLLSEGWGLCYVYETSWQGLEAWLKNMNAYITSYKLPAPEAIYFKNTAYDRETMEAVLKEAGIRTVILDASSGRYGTVTDATADPWYTGAMPWNYTGFATDVELLGRTDGANVCYVLTFSENWDPSLNPYGQRDKESEEKAAFKEILESWKTMIYEESPLDELDKIEPIYLGNNSDEAMQQYYYNSLTTDQQLLLPRFRVANMEDARAFHVEAAEGNKQIQNELDQKKADLQGQIDDLSERIRALYDDFNNQAA